MAKRSNRRPPNRRKGGASRRHREPELDEVLRDLLADPQPLGFLAHASTLAEVLADSDGADGITLESFATALTAGGSTAEVAMLLVLDAFLPGRIPPDLLDRDRPLPMWVARLDETTLGSAAVLSEPSGESGQIVIEVRPVGAEPFTVLCMIDHDDHHAVEDAWAVPSAFDDELREIRELGGDEITIDGIATADAAARLRASLAVRAIAPRESESWPTSRPLVEWVGSLVRGGAGWPQRTTTATELRTLAARIAAHSPLALTRQEREAVRALLELAVAVGPGDPLHWTLRSTASVLDEVDDLEGTEPWTHSAPRAIRAIVRFAHRERRVPAQATGDVLDLIDDFEGPIDDMRDLIVDFQRFLPDDRLPPSALLVRLAEQVGGPEQLDALEAAPPAVQVAVPEDVAPRVDEIVRLTAAVIPDFFDDPGLLDAATLLLRRAAAADPAVFRRRSDPRMTAAAAAWIVAKVNDAFGDRRVQDLMTAFGVRGSPSQRATSLLRPLDLVEWFGAFRNDLGDPSLLTPRRREQIISRRDRARAELQTEVARVDDVDFPTRITLDDGRTIEVQRSPGLAAAMMRDLQPHLAAQGVDIEEMEDIDSVRRAVDAAVEARNAALFAPDGARRAAATAALRRAALAFAAGDDAALLAVVDAVEPESQDPAVAEVSAVIGLGLELLDGWLGAGDDGAPAGLAGSVRVPKTWSKRAKPATDVVALASRGRAHASHPSLIARHGGRQVLEGVVVVVGATLTAWAARSRVTATDLAARHLG